MKKIILFGVRSPLVVEYEETIARLGITLEACVSLNNGPRAQAIHKIISVDDIRAGNFTAPFLTCAFDPARRKVLQDMAEGLGLKQAETLIDPTAHIAASTRIDTGGFINAGVIIGAVSIIGKNVLINRASSIGHHVFIADHTSLGPGCTLAGNIRVGTGVIIGAGSTVLPDLRIGDNAVIAAGSVVNRDVEAGGFVAGNPAVAKSFDINKSSLRVSDGE